MSITQVFKLLADETRLRLLLILQDYELTVAELASILQLAQPRVSTHLAKLREHCFVHCRKSGVSSYYRLNECYIFEKYSSLWKSMKQEGEKDSIVLQDQNRVSSILSERAKENNWVDSVAGDMERQYSPGRSWEATTRALSYLVDLGNVLDIGSGDGVLAELLHNRAKTYTCIDSSEKIIKEAQKRLSRIKNINFHVADMHNLNCFTKYDTVFLLHVLTYSKNPQQAIQQATNSLVTGGKLLISTLNQHQHIDIVKDFGHVNNGFTPKKLEQLAKKSGLRIVSSRITSKESRKPHFEVITLEAIKL